ncbi:enoyl-CoA hydratase family protein [soil metagenome]
MSDTPVRTAHDGAVCTITLDSPANRNALSRALVDGLRAALEAAERDGDVRVVVLQAEGPAFCAGADLKEAAGADAEAQAATSRRMLALFRAIAALSAPVIARVHAPVRAGGIGIVAACDIAVVSTDASFALGEVRLGLAPAIISTVVVPRLTDRTASHLLLSGQTFDGAHAAEIGLVTSAVEAAALDSEITAIAEALAASPAQGLEETKRLLNRPLLDRIDRDGGDMTQLSARLFQSDTAQEHFRHFLDRGR